MTWQAWPGDREFKGDTPLRVKFRCGRISNQVLPANKWRGKWGHPFPENCEYDIVEVRIEK